jgi:NAD(P)-dependent dehydrogenase (short-subunit alcohol dehydrogenase family)
VPGLSRTSQLSIPTDSASKAAVNSMAKTGANQLARTGIRVNSICPGLIETGMTTDTFEYAKVRGNLGKVGQLNPLGRWAVAEEIGQMALFLASGKCSLCMLSLQLFILS